MSARETGAGELKPVDMMLFCPKCGFQHVDAPTPDWTNPPHRSHLCHECGCVWRPADVPTNGVAGIQTFGAADTVFYNRAALSRPQPTPAGEIVERLNRKIESVSAWMTSDLRAFYIEIRDALEQQAATIAERDARIEALEKALGAIIRKQDNGTGNAPGHGHSRIGIWDDDPGNAAVGRANLPCEWCETWNEARATLERRGQ
jgi:hypothetical protein